MTAAHNQADARKQVFVKGDFTRVDMRLQVIDCNERFFFSDAQRLSRRQADEQRPRQAGLVHDRDGVKVVERDLRLFKSFGDDGQNRFQVRSRRNLGHDAPETLMRVDLRRQGRAEYVSISVDDCRRRLVATCFDR